MQIFKSKVPTIRSAYTSASPTAVQLEAIDLIRQEMQSRKEQCQRVSPYIVRVTVGNEITDYQLPYQDQEVLWAVDFSGMTPTAKYFGRFQHGKFTGLKYNYSYFFQDNKFRQYVESTVEYCNGRPEGVQTDFDAQGEVTRRVQIRKSVNQPVPQL